MGFFSELEIEKTLREDHSFPSPELEIRWRIEDLQSRLESFTTSLQGVTECYSMISRSSKDFLAYAPPECFMNEYDILAAISIAEEKLASVVEEKRNLQTDESIIYKSAEQLTNWKLCQKQMSYYSNSELVAA